MPHADALPATTIPSQRQPRTIRRELKSPGFWERTLQQIASACQFTLRTRPYTLTRLDFSNYSVLMDAEFVALEEKVQQTALLCQRLRDENRALRERLNALQGDHRLLGEKIDGARTRIESLLKQIPE